MPLHYQPSKPLTPEQKAWADAFIGTYQKGTSTSWKQEGIVIRYTRAARGNGIWLMVENGRIYRPFPKALRSSP